MTPTFEITLTQLAKTKGRDLLTLFKEAVAMSACALAMQTREEEYLEIAKRYQKQDLNIIAQAFGLLINEMQENPYADILGNFYTEINSSHARQSRGEFYTPSEICTLMARISVDVREVTDKSVPVTVSDPAVGSGGTILALAKELAEHKQVDLLRVTGIDINKTACDMAYINFTLWGIPAHIQWGNALANTTEMAWKNIHWLRVGEDQRQHYRKIFNSLKYLEQPDTAQADLSQAETKQNSTQSSYQMDFNF